jgi:hypothetical protein
MIEEIFTQTEFLYGYSHIYDVHAAICCSQFEMILSSRIVARPRSMPMAISGTAWMKQLNLFSPTTSFRLPALAKSRLSTLELTDLSRLP